MAIVNDVKQLPQLGDRVKSVALDDLDYKSCVTIEFESGKKIHLHTYLESKRPNPSDSDEQDLLKNGVALEKHPKYSNIQTS